MAEGHPKPGASGLLFDGLEEQRRLVADAGVDMLASHLGQRPVALLARGKPVMLLPVLAQHARESVGGPSSGLTRLCV